MIWPGKILWILQRSSSYKYEKINQGPHKMGFLRYYLSNSGTGPIFLAWFKFDWSELAAMSWMGCSCMYVGV